MAGKPRNRNRSTARVNVASPSLLTQIIALMMHAPIEEAKRTLDVAHAILDARKSGSGAPLTQPALPGTTAASAGAGYSPTTASGAPRRKPGPKPKAVVEGANAAVDAATASATGGQPSPAAAAKGPRRVPANKLPGAGTRPPVGGADAVAGGDPVADGLPDGDAPLPDQGSADDVVEPAGSEVNV